MKSALDVSRALNTVYRILSLNDCALTNLNSFPQDDAMNIIKKENTMAEMRVDWNRMHERVHKYAALIEALGAVEERSIR